MIKEFFVLFVMLYHPQTGTLSQVRMWSDAYGAAIMFEDKESCKRVARPQAPKMANGQSYAMKFRCDAFPAKNKD